MNINLSSLFMHFNWGHIKIVRIMPLSQKAQPAVDFLEGRPARALITLRPVSFCSSATKSGVPKAHPPSTDWVSANC
jgi:hypothetical protein